MVAYSLSDKAVSDLDGIFDYTILNFVLEQARTYPGCKNAFRYSPTHPASAAQPLAPKLTRHEHQSHIIPYRVTATGILIVRVLYTITDAQHLFVETETHEFGQ